MKIVTWLIPVAGALFVSGHALAGDTAGALIDHPAVSVARTGVRPAYEDANKVYGHPAGGRAGAATATEHPLQPHPSVTILRTGAHPDYQDAMKVYRHPAGGTSAVSSAPSKASNN